MCLLPGLSFGENPRIAELTRSKQEKMERLQKCEGTTKALKIAGLSTIGLTAVGVVGNVVESQKIKEYQGQSNALDTQIAQTKKEIEKAETEKNKTATAAGSTEPTNPTETPTTSTTGLADVDKDIDGSSFKAYSKDGTCDIYANDKWEPPVKNPAQTCSELEKEQWEVQFSYGRVSGNSNCSSTSGNYPVAGDPASSDDGQYCWCKARYYTPSGGQGQDVASSSWVFRVAGYDASDCARFCASNCADDVRDASAFRKAVFAGSGN